MLVLLVSLSMLFVTLMMGYLFFRLTSDVWPPMGLPKADLFFPTVSTLVIILSSLSYAYFEKTYSFTHKALNIWSLMVTVILACIFLFSQAKLWNHMNDIGLYVEGGVFPSILHGFTWIHAAHIVLAFVLLLYLVLLFSKAPFKADRTQTILNIGKVWHFLGIVWFVMYLGIFVI